MAGKQRARGWWATETSDEPGWFVEVSRKTDDGHWELETASRMAGFPVDVDRFEADEGYQLSIAIEAAFPGASVVGFEGPVV